VITPDELTRDDNNTVNGHSVPRDSDMDWSDVHLSGNGFALCPGKHMSAGTHPVPQLQSLLHLQPNSESALHSHITSPLDPELFQMFEMPSSEIRGDPPTSHTSRQSSFDQVVSQSGALDFTSLFTPTPLSLNSPEIRGDITGTAQDRTFEQSSGLSSECDCLASIRLRPDELGLQRSSVTKVTPTDTLFMCVEKGIDQLSTMLSCTKCDFNGVNPMLIVTHVNQLALMLSEIVHRLTHCQSPESVPTIFQFGRYSVQKSKMRTSLLIGMIELHVSCLIELITRLERFISDQARLLLVGAKSMVLEMRETLKSFPGGSNTLL
jgi:hypothetical protein